MGAPLDLTSRSPFRLRSARTLSTTLLGSEFLQRPQHVLSNFLDPTSSLAGLGQVHHHSPFLCLFLGLCLGLFPRPPPLAFQSEICCSLGFFSGWAAK